MLPQPIITTGALRLNVTRDLFFKRSRNLAYVEKYLSFHTDNKLQNF